MVLEGMHMSDDEWRPADSEMEDNGANSEKANPLDKNAIVGHFEPGPSGDGLEGSTTEEAGIQGRLTVAGGLKETPRSEYDWQPYVEVDQPVQSTES
jgi:hypothetical protein